MATLQQAIPNPMSVRDPQIRRILQALDANIRALYRAVTGEIAGSSRTSGQTLVVRAGGSTGTPSSLVTQSELTEALALKQNQLGYVAENVAQRGVANGYPPLDADGLVPLSFLPESVTDEKCQQVVESETAGTDVSIHRLVKYDADGEVVYVDGSDPDDVNLVCGLTLQSVSAGGAVNVLKFGVLTDPSFSFTPDTPLFVGTTGQISETPGTGFTQQIGVSRAATGLFFAIFLGVEKA